MVTKEYEISLKAFAKLVLHSLKYPHATVNGLLLGKVADHHQSGNGDQPENELVKCSSVQFVDAIPLCHFNHGLTPMVEVALLQTAAYAKKHRLQILGYYHADKNFHDTQPDVISQKIAEKLIEICGLSTIVTLNGVALATWLAQETQTEKVLIPYTFVEGKWKTGNGVQINLPDSHLQSIRKFVFDLQLHSQLYDFDNHLEDLTCNWLNPQLEPLIKAVGEQS